MILPRVFKVTVFVIIGLTVLNFIPVKFAVKECNENYVFVKMPKLGDYLEWAMYEYSDSGFCDDIKKRCILNGDSPDIVLNSKEFDYIDLFQMPGDNRNKFIIRYDKTKDIHGGHIDIPICEVNVKDWDILYPINRVSFRRYCTPKSYLTIYDYNWINIIRNG